MADLTSPQRTALKVLRRVRDAKTGVRTQPPTVAIATAYALVDLGLAEFTNGGRHGDRLRITDEGRKAA